jgi:methylmalonyl-CoA/ethylmalonyl-CoA epimerase
MSISNWFYQNEPDHPSSGQRWKKGIMLRKIQHIGILVEDLERAISKFRGFGLSFTEVSEIEKVGVRIAFFSMGDTMLEFLHYAGPDKGHPIVRSQKGAINHLCFEVDDLSATIKDFEKKGAKLVDGFPKNGAHGPVAFFYPETTEGILIEICQP